MRILLVLIGAAVLFISICGADTGDEDKDNDDRRTEGTTTDGAGLL
jgi:hypothetical protein